MPVGGRGCGPPGPEPGEAGHSPLARAAGVPLVAKPGGQVCSKAETVRPVLGAQAWRRRHHGEPGTPANPASGSTADPLRAPLPPRSTPW